MIKTSNFIDEICTDIAVAVEDPNAWNLTVRRIAGRLNLKLYRLPFTSVLEHTVYGLIDEAQKQGKTEAQIRSCLNEVLDRTSRAWSNAGESGFGNPRF